MRPMPSAWCRPATTGGIRVFEFVNRGENALAVFTELQAFVQRALPRYGAGHRHHLHSRGGRAVHCGRRRVCGAALATAEVAEVCRAHDIPWLPGALTPTEIYNASQLGAAVVKIFPGNVVGPDYVKALRGPMPHIKLMVTGGVEPTHESLSAWFGAGVNAVGMGSQLFKNADDTDALAARIGELMEFVETLKQ